MDINPIADNVGHDGEAHINPVNQDQPINADGGNVLVAGGDADGGNAAGNAGQNADGGNLAGNGVNVADGGNVDAVPDFRHLAPAEIAEIMRMIHERRVVRRRFCMRTLSVTMFLTLIMTLIGFTLYLQRTSPIEFVELNVVGSSQSPKCLPLSLENLFKATNCYQDSRGNTIDAIVMVPQDFTYRAINGLGLAEKFVGYRDIIVLETLFSITVTRIVRHDYIEVRVGYTNLPNFLHYHGRVEIEGYYQALKAKLSKAKEYVKDTVKDSYEYSKAKATYGYNRTAETTTKAFKYAKEQFENAYNGTAEFASDVTEYLGDVFFNIPNNFRSAYNHTSYGLGYGINATVKNIKSCVNSAADGVGDAYVKTMDFIGMCNFQVYGNEGCNPKFEYCDGRYVVSFKKRINLGKGLAIKRRNCRGIQFVSTHNNIAVNNRLEEEGFDYDFETLYNQTYVYIESESIFDFLYKHKIDIYGYRNFKCNESSLHAIYCLNKYYRINCTVEHHSQDVFSKNNFYVVNLTSKTMESQVNYILNHHGSYLFECATHGDGILTSAFYNYNVTKTFRTGVIELITDSSINDYQRISYQRLFDGQWIDMAFYEVWAYVLMFNYRFATCSIVIVIAIIVTANTYGYRVGITGPVCSLVAFLLPRFYPDSIHYCILFTAANVVINNYIYTNEKSSRRLAWYIQSLFTINATAHAFGQFEYKLFFLALVIQYCMYWFCHYYYHANKICLMWLSCHQITPGEFEMAKKVNICINGEGINMKPLSELLKQQSTFESFCKKYNLDTEYRFSNISSESKKLHALTLEYIRLIAEMHYGGKKNNFKYFNPTITVSPDVYENGYILPQLFEDAQRAELLKLLGIEQKSTGIESLTSSKAVVARDYTFHHKARIFNFSVTYNGLDVKGYAYQMKTNILRISRHFLVENGLSNEDNYRYVHNDIVKLINDGKFNAICVNIKEQNLKITGLCEYAKGCQLWDFIVVGPTVCDPPVASYDSGACVLLHIVGSQIYEHHGICDGKGNHNVSTIPGYCGSPIVTPEGLAGFHIFGNAAPFSGKLLNEIFLSRKSAINYYIKPSGYSFHRGVTFDIFDKTIPPPVRLDVDLSTLTAMCYIHNLTKSNRRKTKTIELTPDQKTKMHNYFENNNQICVNKVENMIERVVYYLNANDITCTHSDIESIAYDLYLKFSGLKFVNDSILRDLQGDPTYELPQLMCAFRDYVTLENVCQQARQEFVSKNFNQNKFIEKAQSVINAVKHVLPYTAAQIESAPKEVELDIGSRMQLGKVSEFLNSLTTTNNVDNPAYINLRSLHDEVLSSGNKYRLAELLEKTYEFADSIWSTYITNKFDKLSDTEKATIAKHFVINKFKNFMSNNTNFQELLLKRGREEQNDKFIPDLSSKQIVEGFRDFASEPFYRQDFFSTIESLDSELFKFEHLFPITTGVERHEYVSRLESYVKEAVKVIGASEDGVSLIRKYLTDKAKLSELKSQILGYEDNDLDRLEKMRELAEKDDPEIAKYLKKGYNKRKAELDQERAREKKINDAQNYVSEQNAMQIVNNDQNKRNLDRALHKIVHSLLGVHRMAYGEFGTLGSLDKLLEKYGESYVHNILDGAIGATYNLTDDGVGNIYIHGFLSGTKVHRVVGDNLEPKWVFETFYFKDDPSKYLNGDYYEFPNKTKVYKLESDAQVFEMSQVPVDPLKINNELQYTLDGEVYNIIKIDNFVNRSDILAYIRTPGFPLVNHNVVGIPAFVGQVEGTPSYPGTYSRDGHMDLPCGCTIVCAGKLQTKSKSHVHSDYGCYWHFNRAFNAHLSNEDGQGCRGVKGTPWIKANKNGPIHRCNGQPTKCSSDHRICDFDCYMELYTNCDKCAYCGECVSSLARNRTHQCASTAWHGFPCTTKHCDQSTCNQDHHTIEAFSTNLGTKYSSVYSRRGDVIYSGDVPIIQIGLRTDWVPYVHNEITYSYNPQTLVRQVPRLIKQYFAQAPEVKKNKLMPESEAKRQSADLAKFVSCLVEKQQELHGTESKPERQSVICMICNASIDNPLEHQRTTSHENFLHRGEEYVGYARLLALSAIVLPADIFANFFQTSDHAASQIRSMHAFASELNNIHNQHFRGAGGSQ